MSKYKEVFNVRDREKSKKADSQKDGSLEIQKSGNKRNDERQVNLGIKIAESRRRFWVGQAKLQGVTISEVIIEALSKRFGEPQE